MKNQPAQSYPLPYAFPDGPVWAAIKNGLVMNMIYMNKTPDCIQFQEFRQKSRAVLAKDGAVWTGEVINRCFIPKFESNDKRHNEH